MEQENKNLSRNKFLAWVIGLGSLLALPSFLRFGSSSKKKTKTVKMLTEDGRLVEIEVHRIPQQKSKAKTADIHNWIKSKPQTSNRTS